MKRYPSRSYLMLGAVVALLPCMGAEEVDDRSPDKQRESLVRVEARIDSLKNAPLAGAMSKLSEILRKTSKRNIYQVEERWETHSKAKAAILALPEHVDFFRSEFKRIKAEFRDKDDENRYDLERVMLFETMGLLPSPQIVPVLVELLDDNEDEPPLPRPHQDYSDYSANDEMAAVTLGKLIDEPFFDQAGVEAWKLWFSQIKESGNGFRLKGSDAIHRLPGTGEGDLTSNKKHVLDCRYDPLIRTRIGRVPENPFDPPCFLVPLPRCSSSLSQHP